MGSPNESSMPLACPPPCLDPPDVSSSGPPGACMTPSIVTKVVVMIFRISDSLVNSPTNVVRGSFSRLDRALVAAAPENEYVGGGRDGGRSGGPCQCDLRRERQ